MNRLISILALVASMFAQASAAASVAGSISRKMIDATVDAAAKTSGKTLETPAARKVATAEVRRLSTKYGTEALKVVEDGGLELLEAVPKYGDELVQIATKATPQARRALALNVTELLPLTRRVGVDAIELEAKAPGQAIKVYRLFCDDAGKAVATTVRTEDIPRIIKYGEVSDNDATRRLLLETYKKEGASLFERIPPKVILAGGLTAAMLYGTNRITEPDVARAEVLRDHPEIVERLMLHSIDVWAAVGLVVVFALFWRFGLMPWHRRRVRGETGGEIKNGHSRTVRN